MPDISTLISDIDRLFTEGIDLGFPLPSPPVEEAFNAFLENIGKLTKEALSKKYEPETPYLRPSNLGTPDRKLWFLLNTPPSGSNSYSGTKLRSFLFGNIIEQLLVLCAKLAGHEVTEEQAAVERFGLSGSKDCRIDGITIDAKSSSPFAFGKFKDGSLLRDPASDMFGYKEQLGFYSEGEVAGWLAMDKSSGELALLLMDEFDAPRDIGALVEHKKAVAALAAPPEAKCYEPMTEKNGNRKLARGCQMCQFKLDCWGRENLRGFRYSTGVELFTHIEALPRVEEVSLI